MLVDCEYEKTETFGMRIYHKFVGDSMRRGLKWMRYRRDGDCISIIDLRLQSSVGGIVNKECADRYERWYRWMKKPTAENRQSEAK